MSTISEIDFEDTEKTKYESFPDGGLGDTDYESLRSSEMLKDVDPIAGFRPRIE